LTISTLDPKVALVVVDLQKGIVAHPCVHPVSDVVANAAALADTFRSCELPVVLVHVAGIASGRTETPLSSGPRPEGWAELIPALNVHQTDHRVEKRTWGAFRNTDLESYLKGRGVTQVVVAGIATSIGVESTARHAYELGFNVTIAIDAITDRNLGAHNNSVTWVFPRLGETGTTREIIEILEATQV
jgi:nicotinamidase-related amidase